MPTVQETANLTKLAKRTTAFIDYICINLPVYDKSMQLGEQISCLNDKFADGASTALALCSLNVFCND